MLRVAPGRLLALLLLALFTAAFAGPAPAKQKPAFVGPTLQNPATPPDFRLRDQHQQLVHLAGQRGKVVLITFLYTHCPDLCPLTAMNLNTALGSLGAARKNVIVLAISVDPKGDTPSAVTTFVRTHRLRPQFHYLTGSTDELEHVWHAYKVASVQRAGDDVDHTLYTLLVDRNGTARVLFDSLAKPSAIAHDVRQLLG
jgi:protein SCO1